MEASLWAQDQVLLEVLREGPPPALCLLVGDSLCAGVTNAHSNLPFFPLSVAPLRTLFALSEESTLISYDLMLILNYNSRNSASKSYSFLKMIFIEKIMGFILTFSYMHTRYTLQSCLPRSYSLVLFPIPAGPTLTFRNSPFCFHTPPTQTKSPHIIYFSLWVWLILFNTVTSTSICFPVKYSLHSSLWLKSYSTGDYTTLSLPVY